MTTPLIGFLRTNFMLQPLLGPGTERRYFECDERYEIPMQMGDPPFVLGGESPGDPSPDLVVDAERPIAARQAELFRLEEDLYVRGLASGPGNWIRHERGWLRLEVGAARHLCAGDCLVLGVNEHPTSLPEKTLVTEYGVFWIEFGDGASSFRLAPASPHRSPFLPNFGPWDPIFNKSPERMYHPNGSFRGYRAPFQPPFEERFRLWRSRGLDRIDRLVDIAGRFHHELPPRRQRQLFEEAISIGERLSLQHRYARQKLKGIASAADLSLARAYLNAGFYWSDFRRNNHWAEQCLERGRSLLEAEIATDHAAMDLWLRLGVALYRTHESALGRERSRNRHAESGRHYEGMAKYVEYVLPPDPDAESIDDTRLTRREYLERAATAYKNAGPGHAQSLERVIRQIQELEGPYR
jgi:hypothetical protein